MAGNRRLAALAVLLGGLVQAVAADEPRRFDGYSVVRVTVENADQLARLPQLVESIWTDYPGIGRVDVMVSPAQLAELGRAGFKYVDWIPDVQVLMDQERVAGPRGWFDAYHNYTDIVGYLNGLVAAYPTLAQMVNVGTTIEGRTMWGIRIAGPSQSATAPGVLYFGAVHSREWIAATVPQYIANYLLTNYGTDPVVTDLVDNVEWFLVPVGNPDGYTYTWTTNRDWRKNRRNNGGSYGVDINRNWGEGWGGEGSSGTPSALDYRGTAPFSEPETQALRDMFINHPRIRAQLDLHSYSQLILWPYGYTSALPADQTTYLAVGQAMHDLVQGVHGLSYTYGPIYTTIYPASGGSCDWTYSQRGVLSFSYELRDTGSYGFVLPASQIIPQNEEILPAILHLTNTDWVRSPIRFVFPGGLPDSLMAGEATTIAVELAPQYEQIVPGTPRMYYRYDPTGPFVESALTLVSGNTYEAVLPATNCLSTPEFYFAVDGDGGTTAKSPRSAPADVYTAEMASPSATVFAESMSTNPGWTTQGQWAWGKPNGLGSHNKDPLTGYTGDNVYGYNLNGDYANGLAAAYYLTTPAINCTGKYGVELRFWRWLGVESNSNYDKATVQVSANGTSWTTVWQAADGGVAISDTAWQRITLDISAVADNQPSVQVRWGMGPTDSGVTYPGWNIDDVSLYAPGCVVTMGDHNGDSVVDLADLAQFVPCVTGEEGGLLPNCGIFDFDTDTDVDLEDFAAFQSAFAG